MTLLLGKGTVERLIDVAALVPVMEEAYRLEAGEAVVAPPRLNVFSEDVGFLRLGPAVIRGTGRTLMGFKAFNGRPGLGVRYFVCLYDAESGELLTLVDADYLTSARTGATTGLATKYLAKPGECSVAVLGSGVEARSNLLGVAAVRPLREVRVFSPTPAKRAAFATDMESLLSCPVRAADSAEDCVAGADVVVTATNTTGHGGNVALRGKWLQPGVHLNAIGSTMPTLREIDENSFLLAHSVVIDAKAQASEESGDVRAALAAGWDASGAVALRDVVSGLVTARSSDQDITLFKSVGSAVQDLMAAAAVYDIAVEAGEGVDLGDFLSLHSF